MFIDRQEQFIWDGRVESLTDQQRDGLLDQVLLLAYNGDQAAAAAMRQHLEAKARAALDAGSEVIDVTPEYASEPDLEEAVPA